MNTFKTVGPVLLVVAIIIGLFVWGVASQHKSAAYVPGTTVICTSEGQALVDHIHPDLHILVDGVPDVVPANIGITQGCVAELHTHDTDGVIHVETVTPGRLDELTLADFFAVWGESLSRDGYSYTVTVDGVPITDLSSVHFKDKQQIELSYTSVAE